MLTQAEAVWLACAVDGEGTIGMVRASRRGKSQSVCIPVVLVSNVNIAFVQKACDLIRKSCGAGCVAKAHKGVNYPVIKAQVVSQKSCRVVLGEILPHLIIKKRRAEAIMRWIDARAEVRKHRPGRGGGTPYSQDTEDLLQFLKQDRLDK